MTNSSFFMAYFKCLLSMTHMGTIYLMLKTVQVKLLFCVAALVKKHLKLHALHPAV